MASVTVHRMALWVPLVALLVAGCGAAPGEGASSHSAATESASAPASSPEVSAVVSATPTARPLVEAQILGAPVPSLCGHAAGTLVDGRLPGIPERDGWVAMADPAHTPTRFVPFEADGEHYAAAVFECNRGGVPWPQRVVIYDERIQPIGAFDTSDVTGEGRQSVTGMRQVEGGVELDVVNVYQEGDAACCGTAEATMRVKVSGGAASASLVALYTEFAVAEQVLKAAKAHDHAALAKLTAGQAREWTQQDNGFLGPEARVTGCSAPSDVAWPDLPAVPFDRECSYGADGIYVAGVIGLEHTGFGAWRAVYMTEETTD